MVTWGTNTVHTIGTQQQQQQQPAVPSFGTGAPAATTPGFSFSSPQQRQQQPSSSATTGGGGGGMFGSSASSGGGIFGTAAANPTGGSVFGSSAAPTMTWSIFGSPAASLGAPATGTSLFGSPATPAPAAGSIFGSTWGGGRGGGMFGFPAANQQQQQQQQQPQMIPAHAALQAHMNASARNEEARVIQRMETIHRAYTGTTAVATSGDGKSHCFSTVLYNPVTPQQRQMQAAHHSMMMMTTTTTDGINSSGQLFAPPKPPQISESDWNLACVRNPDSQNFVPVEVVGAENLQVRAVLHQEQAETIAKHVAKIHQAAELLQQRQTDVQRQLEVVAQKHQNQLARLLKLMKHVEVARCFNVPLQPSEMEASSRMLHLKRTVVEGQLVPAIARLAESDSMAQTSSSSGALVASSAQPPSAEGARRMVQEVSPQQQQQWMKVMKEHREALAKMTELMRKDQRDLHLIQDRVMATETVASRPARI